MKIQVLDSRAEIARVAARGEGDPSGLSYLHRHPWGSDEKGPLTGSGLGDSSIPILKYVHAVPFPSGCPQGEVPFKGKI